VEIFSESDSSVCSVLFELGILGLHPRKNKEAVVERKKRKSLLGIARRKYWGLRCFYEFSTCMYDIVKHHSIVSVKLL